jgi:threonine/homoserine/homoserine lactone efflux protein
VLSAVLGFAAASTLIVLAPGPDTLVVVRNLVRGGRRRAVTTVFGVLTGLFLWMLAAVVGLAAVLRASETGYDVLKIAGACYLLWLAVESFRSRTAPASGGAAPAGSDPALVSGDPAAEPATAAPTRRGGLLGSGYISGLATNLLNPKVGVFFIAFLPGFVPHGADVPMTSLLLGSIFILEGMLYFAILIALADRVVGWMTRPRTRRWLDRAAGVVFVGFSIRLATET